MVDQEAPSKPGIPVSVRLLHGRIAVMAVSFAVVMVPFLVLAFAGKTFRLHTFKFYSNNTDTSEMMAYVKEMNSRSSNIIALFNKPKDWVISSIIPVCFLTFATSRRMDTKPAFAISAVFIGVELFINYLINNGFHAINVLPEVGKLIPVITASDMAANTVALQTLLNHTSNASKPVPEAGANLMLNTVLRNVLAPIALKESQPMCSPTIDENMIDTSQFATGLVQSFGFPSYSWQSSMLPINRNANDNTYTLSLSDGTPDFTSVNLNMSVNTAANLFIHAIHVSRFFFRWFNASEGPLNATRELMNPTNSHFESPVAARELFNLSQPASTGNDNATWFLGTARDIFRRSLSSNANITAHESNMTFSNGVIAETGNITYDAVTFDVPLRRNFYYRKLIADDHQDLLVEDKNKTALYSNISYVNDTSNIYYDLDKSNDCGPYPGSCIMPRVQEYDFYGHKYQPDPQIKATAVCINADGSEDFIIDFQFDVSPNGYYTNVSARWACEQRSSTSMYIVSFGSRIIGDNMYDSPAPDATTTNIDRNRSTLLNPRKVYSLTVVRLAWQLVNFSAEFHAECFDKAKNCTGLSYQLDSPVNGSSIDDYTRKASNYILVGNDRIPVTELSQFPYNNMEIDPNKFTAARWLPLMTLATPADDADSGFSQKGDVLFLYNFNSYSWSSKTLTGYNCSDSAEDVLNHVVNNHYYMHNGLQASFTAGMYYLFQNGVVRGRVNSADPQSTLKFDGNEQYIHVSVSIPRTNFIFTCVGIGFVLLGSIFAMAASRNGQRSMIKKTVNDVEVISEMIQDDAKYPTFLLEFHFGENINGSYDQYQIDGIKLRSVNGSGKPLSICSHHGVEDTFGICGTGDNADHKPAISGSCIQRKSDTEESATSSKSSESNVMQ